MIDPTTTWLDIIPVIPLARGVPVVCLYEKHVYSLSKRVACNGVVLTADRTGWMLDTERRRRSVFPARLVRVDLDNPLAFGFALRLLRKHAGCALRAEMAHGDDWRGIFERWLDSETTDADRLALAQALAEVME